MNANSRPLFSVAARLCLLAPLAAWAAASCGGSDVSNGEAPDASGGGGGGTDGAVDAPAETDASPDAESDSSDAADAPEGDADLGATSCAVDHLGAGHDCGAQGVDDCCATTSVPGGTFYRSYDGLTPGHMDKSYPATVSDFELGRFETTVGRFRAFVEAYPGSKPAPDAGANPHIAASGWNSAWDAKLPADKAALRAELACPGGTWADTPGQGETLPITCVSWWTAFAFCAWDERRLPTEAEWNYAAAGGDEQRVYAFSQKPLSAYIDSTLAVYNEAAPEPVGSRSPKGDSRWGSADLAGNVSEWVLDAWADPYPPGQCVNCANLVVANDGRVIPARRAKDLRLGGIRNRFGIWVIRHLRG
jgi:formylglycine-generating enzyme required for sulfatase activity